MITQQRNQDGHAHISEFGAAIVLLLACFVIPLIDLSVIPIRWGLAQSMVTSRVHQLAQSDCLSEALRSFNEEESFCQGLKQIGGVKVKSGCLQLLVSSTKGDGQTRVFEHAGSIPREWLPDGLMGPCMYQLVLTVEAEVEPLLTAPLPNTRIPGLTVPFSVQLKDVSCWENLGRDPSSGEFFINQ